MAEVRQLLPYISAISITKRPTLVRRPSPQRMPDGSEQYEVNQELPGIKVEIVPYLGSVPGPARTYNFPLKSFFEDALEELKAIPTEQQGAEVQNQIAQLTKILADPKALWVEQVMIASGIDDFTSMWSDVFSVALDSFSDWKEPEQSEEIDGLPYEVKELSWNARIPFEGSKSIDLVVGIFEEENTIPTHHSLSFLDKQSLEARDARITQLEAAIQQREEALASLGENEVIRENQLKSEIAAYKNDLDILEKIELGSFSTLLSHPSLQTSLPTVLMGIMGVLKQVDDRWKNLNLTVVQEQLVENFTKIMTQNVT